MRTTSFLVLSLAALLPCRASAEPYRFKKVAESGGGFAGFDAAPALNESGAVAFRALEQRPGMDPIAGIYVGAAGANPNTPGPLTTIATIETQPFPAFPNVLFTSFARPDVNAAGAVAFRASFTGAGAGIFTSQSGVLTTVAQTGQAQFVLGFFGDVSINDASQVAFAANVPLPVAGSEGLFRHTPLTGFDTVATTGVMFQRFGLHPALTNGGTVGFRATLVPQGDAIFGAPVTLDPAIFPDSVSMALSEAALNDQGQAAYVARDLVLGMATLYVETRGVGRKTVASLPDFLSQGVSFNNHGSVAFLTSQGLFLVHADANGDYGPVTNDNKVIGPGDPLFGSTVQSSTMLFDSSALNNNGRLTFRAMLADGRQVVVLAEPVPEPSRTAAWLAAIGAWSAVGRRRHGHSSRGPFHGVA